MPPRPWRSRLGRLLRTLAESVDPAPAGLDLTGVPEVWADRVRAAARSRGLGWVGTRGREESPPVTPTRTPRRALSPWVGLDRLRARARGDAPRAATPLPGGAPGLPGGRAAGPRPDPPARRTPLVAPRLASGGLPPKRLATVRRGVPTAAADPGGKDADAAQTRRPGPLVRPVAARGPEESARRATRAERAEPPATAFVPDRPAEPPPRPAERAPSDGPTRHRLFEPRPEEPRPSPEPPRSPALAPGPPAPAPSPPDSASRPPEFTVRPPKPAPRPESVALRPSPIATPPGVPAPPTQALWPDLPTRAPVPTFAAPPLEPALRRLTRLATEQGAT